MRRRRTFGHPKLREKKDFQSLSKARCNCGVVGSMGLLPTKIESEGYSSSLEQWKKERNPGWIVDNPSYIKL